MAAPIIANKYALLKKLASGGMAEVFLAKQIGLDGFEKLVVLKRILPHLSQDEEFVQMFLDEARTAADLRHPNVVNVFEVGEDEGTFFIAMEFLHGKDIRRTQRKVERLAQDFPLQHALQIIIDAANGLHYAHQKTDLRGRELGIIHRDVSPQNIIVTYDGAAKIVDFGIAKAASSTNQTASGVLKGKYSYMSPEQASAHPMDQRTDLFALGVVAYELVTMRRLFKRESEIHTLNAVIECKVPPASEITPHLPKELDHILQKALHPRPEKRYSSCQEFAFALEELLSEQRLVHSQARVGKFMKNVFHDEITQEKTAEIYKEDSMMSALQSSSHSKWNSVTDKQPATKTIRLTDEAQVASLDMGQTHSINDQGLTEIDPHAKTAVTRTVQELSPSVSLQSLEHSLALAPQRLPILGRLALSGAVLGFIVFFLFYNQTKRGDLVLKTSPVGAHILVDGTAHHQTSPSIIKDLDMGAKHVITLSLAGYEQETVDVVFEADKPNQTLNLHLKQLLIKVALKIETDPSGATLYDSTGKKLGTTPIEMSDINAGETRTFSLKKEGYITLNKTIEIASNQTLKLRLKAAVEQVTPTPPPQASRSKSKSKITQGRLKVLVKPWAIVFINGKKIGETPFKPVKLNPGTYRIRLKNPQINKSVEKTIRIQAGKDLLLKEW